mmetsp:Transcript_126053/g.368356  ORF Transcript_126053/g.368356 Transcript_126053/m.368356 type:complete len:246 (-) Transcript_126053:1926-2663(-)
MEGSVDLFKANTMAIEILHSAILDQTQLWPTGWSLRIARLAWETASSSQPSQLHFELPSSLQSSAYAPAHPQAGAQAHARMHPPGLSRTRRPLLHVQDRLGVPAAPGIWPEMARSSSFSRRIASNCPCPLSRASLWAASTDASCASCSSFTLLRRDSTSSCWILHLCRKSAASCTRSPPVTASGTATAVPACSSLLRARLRPLETFRNSSSSRSHASLASRSSCSRSCRAQLSLAWLSVSCVCRR